MRVSTAIVFGAMVAASSASWALETDADKLAITDTLKVVELSDNEMAEIYGKHLTITNGTGTWVHPVSAFHGTLTITPRQGAVLEKEMLKP